MDARRLVTGAAEIRAAEDGVRRLVGTAIQEGRAAGDRGEVFAPGSITWPAEGMGVALAHRAAPEVRATTTRQGNGKITIEARATPRIVEAYEAGRRALSIEFHSLAEARKGGNVREITSAFVPLVAMVPVGAYNEASAEVRRRLGPSMTTRIKTGQKLDCRCGFKAGVREVSRIEFDGDAFEGILNEIAGGRNVSAIGRGAADVVADTNTGSLGLAMDGGSLAVTVAPLDTEAGRRVTELVENDVEVYARPTVDFEASEYVLEGDVARITAADFAYVLVKPTDRTEGLDPLKPPREGRDRRIRIWL